MPALIAEYLAILKEVLARDFVPNLPPAIEPKGTPAAQQEKAVARAFNAFVLHKLLGAQPAVASQSVVDDWGDLGIDAVYYNASDLTLYILQSKLKADAQITHDESLAFCEGVRKLLGQDFDGFNINVQNRRTDLEGAVEICRGVALVVAHVGSGITGPAKTAIQDLLANRNGVDERLRADYIDFDASYVTKALLNANAVGQVDAQIRLEKCTGLEMPRRTYMGIARMDDLVRLHQDHGTALYAKNIRDYLGHKTDINEAIRLTLEHQPQEFFYLNNGVTALCNGILAGGQRSSDRTTGLTLSGISVINGAQTIASAAELKARDPGLDISLAKVCFTIIETTPEDDFGKEITRARNHQNPVFAANFASLDDEQERLRRELAYLGIHYVYKAGEVGAHPTSSIRIEESIQALALIHSDPRYTVWLKKEPARLSDPSSQQYQGLFNASVTGFRLANAVRVFRYVQAQVIENTNAATGMERLINKHSAFALAWILSKRIRAAINAATLVDEAGLARQLSRPTDELRATIIDETQPLTANKGPLALFRNQTDVVPLLSDLMTDYYGLSTDPVVGYKQREQRPNDPYPVPLFDYLISKAPQIEIV